MQKNRAGTSKQTANNSGSGLPAGQSKTKATAKAKRWSLARHLVVWSGVGVFVLTATLVWHELGKPDPVRMTIPVKELPVQIKGKGTVHDDVTITLCGLAGECVRNCKLEILGEKDAFEPIDGKTTLASHYRGKTIVVLDLEGNILGSFVVPIAGHPFVSVYG